MGQGADDFAMILADMKVTLSYQSTTTTTDELSGNETNTYGEASNKDYIFFLNEKRYMFDKLGLVEVGDAYIMCRTTDTVNRYDKFSVGGRTYIVNNTYPLRVFEELSGYYAVCFLLT